MITMMMNRNIYHTLMVGTSMFAPNVSVTSVYDIISIVSYDDIDDLSK